MAELLLHIGLTMYLDDILILRKKIIPDSPFRIFNFKIRDGEFQVIFHTPLQIPQQIYELGG